MPTYDYRCDSNGRVLEVSHRMSERLSTWGELCARAGIDLGETPAEAPVQCLATGGNITSSTRRGSDPAPSAACGTGACCPAVFCGLDSGSSNAWCGEPYGVQHVRQGTAFPIHQQDDKHHQGKKGHRQYMGSQTGGQIREVVSQRHAEEQRKDHHDRHAFRDIGKAHRIPASISVQPRPKEPVSGHCCGIEARARRLAQQVVQDGADRALWVRVQPLYQAFPIMRSSRLGERRWGEMATGRHTKLGAARRRAQCQPTILRRHPYLRASGRARGGLTVNGTWP